MKFADGRDRDMWRKVMTLDIMSSEDSTEDDGDEVLMVRPLPWRSSRVEEMFQEIDKMNLEGKTPQSRRQMKRRVLGEMSRRPRSCNTDLPQWAFV